MIPTPLAAPRVLTTPSLRLVPLGPEHFAGTWAALQDPESMRLTGTHAAFTEDAVRDHLAGLTDRGDRVDWAVLRGDDHIGEVVLNELDPENRAMGFRIALSGPDALGRGYGTEATRAVVAYGFDVIGLHRIELEVYAFNPRAQRAYEKAGFVVEGRRRHALLWHGEWTDAITMSTLETDPRG